LFGGAFGFLHGAPAFSDATAGFSPKARSFTAKPGNPAYRFSKTFVTLFWQRTLAIVAGVSGLRDSKQAA
jgi:hypothetical protein